ncbi:MAG: helix-turn-helix transcriptional regulator [Pseudomonadota bacterium]
MSDNLSRSVKALGWLCIGVSPSAEQGEALSPKLAVVDEEKDAPRALASELFAEGQQVCDLAFGDEPVRLSPRERDCLHWAAMGRSTKEIADTLSLSDNTVNEYFASAQRKLKASNRVQAVMRAYMIDLISAQHTTNIQGFP